MKLKKERKLVKIDPDAKSMLSILAKRSSKSEVDYLSQAVVFIYKSGVDVYTKVTPNVSDLVTNLGNKIIGFMKKREKDFFVPMNEKMVALTENHVKFFDALSAMDMVEFAIQKTEEKKPSFKVPEEVKKEEENGEEKKLFGEGINPVAEDQNESIEIAQLEGEKNTLSKKLEKAQKRERTFRDELEFLVSKIVRSGVMGGGKFSLNISQRDYERIKKILDDN